jgi:hypothetical protein
MAAELTPSLLLYLGQVPPDVQALLKRSRTCRKKGEWTLAEWCAVDARDACKHRGDHESLAIAQLHLADVYCDVGELGEALGLCEEAYRILHGQAAKAQRHNEAVAAYAQGLLHERFLFGDDMQAVRWYREALELFEKAQEHWASQDDKSFFKTCERASRHVERRKKRILKVRSGGEGRPGAFDVLQPDSREGALRGTITDDNRVEIDGTAYCLHSGALPSKDSDGTRYCFALPIQEPSPAFPAAQEGDYVVVRLQWRLDEGELKTVWSPGVMWVSGEGEEGSWWEMGDFTLSSSGRIWFYPSSSKARVIGDSDIPVKGGPPRDPAGKIKGYIIGLLKPEAQGPEPAGG